MSSSFPLSKAYFVALFCEAILHGIFTVLAPGAVYLLLRKRGQRKHQGELGSTTNTVMLFLTVLMYGLSTAHIALHLRQNLIAFFEEHAADGSLSILNDQGNPLVCTQIALEIINCLIGDCIVAWRAWVLWGRDYRIISPTMVFIAGGVASGIGMVRAFAASPPGQEVYSGEIMDWFLAFGALTFASNVYCVIIISYKAWTTFRAISRVRQGVVIHGRKYHSAILIIIESGVIYCVALVIAIALFVADNNGVYAVADILGHLTGIYPTVIIVLVSLKMSFYDDITHAEKTMTTFQAAQGTGALSTASTAPARRARGPDEAQEAENTFVLQPFSQRKMVGTGLSDSSSKGEGIV